MSGQDFMQLTLFQEDSPASRSVLPGSSEARTMTVTSGRRCLEYCGMFGPVGLLVRTLLESSIWRSTRCLLTWKMRGTPARRLLFQLVPSTPPHRRDRVAIVAYWGCGPAGSPSAEHHLKRGQLSGVVMYPTPRAQSATGPSNAPNRQGSPDLQTVAGGQLNPEWVEWLMGYPIGWTELSV